MPASAQSSAAGPAVEIVRSHRRRRTIAAYRDGDRTVVRVPAGLSAAVEARCVADMLDRLRQRELRLEMSRGSATPARSAQARLSLRATELSTRYLAGAAVPASVRWVTNQNTRWGSCTPAERTIRLSHRLAAMPQWVVDYVLVHELAHLLVHGHGPEFWRLVERYPRTERARGYLEGVAAAAGLDLTDLTNEADAADEGPEADGACIEHSGGTRGVQ